jgi:hypothetical protein
MNTLSRCDVTMHRYVTSNCAGVCCDCTLTHCTTQAACTRECLQ